ncbi:MAG: glycosyltransferase family 1 protein, partial [Chloroflexi bacterium]
PVVTSNVSSLPEVVGDAGLMVEPADVEGLAAAIGRVLEDGDLRREMVHRGLARAREFTWGRAARQLLEVYTRCNLAR